LVKLKEILKNKLIIDIDQMKKLFSICGSDSCDDNLSNNALKIAQEVGEMIAKKGGVIICGGLGGVMTAACKGAKMGNGITIGILPHCKEDANDFIDIAIPTNIGNIRNFLVSQAGDVTIAIGGRWGTLNEIAFRMILEKPLILIKGTGGCVDEIINGRIMQGIESNYFIADSAKDAVDKAYSLI
jgi:uncharacterized protein (TIGR00725 family)